MTAASGIYAYMRVTAGIHADIPFCIRQVTGCPLTEQMIELVCIAGPFPRQIAAHGVFASNATWRKVLQLHQETVRVALAAGHRTYTQAQGLHTTQLCASTTAVP